jgi:hypothetical protein
LDKEFMKIIRLAVVFLVGIMIGAILNGMAFRSLYAPSGTTIGGAPIGYALRDIPEYVGKVKAEVVLTPARKPKDL